MFNNNPNGIIIARRADEQPDPLNDDALQRYVEESEPETSARARMFAVLLLAFTVALVFGGAGMILRLLW